MSLRVHLTKEVAAGVGVLGRYGTSTVGSVAQDLGTVSSNL